MEVLLRSAVLSFIMGMSCKVFFETIVPRRKMRYKWMEYTVILAFAAGFLVIAVTEIPPYILQPVRVIVVVALIAMLYFRINVIKDLILSVAFCGIYWAVSAVMASMLYILPYIDYGRVNNNLEAVTMSVHLCLMLWFHYKYKNRIRGLAEMKWEKFGLFPLFGMIAIMAVNMIPYDGTDAGMYARLAAVFGLALINVCIYYFIANVLEKEAEVQQLRLLRERTQNQMNLYYSMQKSYEKQKRFLHDYKNQLNTIQGMLGNGQTEETLQYISGLTGSLKKSMDHINTNHAVVNVVLNQKYQEACEKGIVMTISVNDLSGLTIDEEEIVSLLVNLMDNAIEACEKLEKDKIIQFKMILEDGQLILSVRNPVKETVKIKGKTIVTNKQDKSSHGIGLLNIDSVIDHNAGTSVLKCENGWFIFSAMIPIHT